MEASHGRFKSVIPPVIQPTDKEWKGSSGITECPKRMRPFAAHGSMDPDRSTMNPARFSISRRERHVRISIFLSCMNTENGGKWIFRDPDLELFAGVSAKRAFSRVAGIRELLSVRLSTSSYRARSRVHKRLRAVVTGP